MLTLFLVLTPLLAAACGGAAETPTLVAVPTALPVASLPTAIPPEGETSLWAIDFRLEFPASFWTLGQHQYGFFMDCAELGQVQSAGDYHLFQVTNAVAAFEDPIYLRLAGLSTGPLDPINLDAIHPDQATVAVVTILGITEEQARQAASSDDCEIVFGWDGIKAENLTAGEPFQP
jgi:hypothetical protein